MKKYLKPNFIITLFSDLDVLSTSTSDEVDENTGGIDGSTSGSPWL